MTLLLLFHGDAAVVDGSGGGQDKADSSSAKPRARKNTGGHFWKPHELGIFEPDKPAHVLEKPAPKAEPFTNRLETIGAHNALRAIGIDYTPIHAGYEEMIAGIRQEIALQAIEDEQIAAIIAALL